MFTSYRLIKKARVIIHANLAISVFIGQVIFVFAIDIAPKVGIACIIRHVKDIIKLLM